jgi:hypothetical protein
MRTRDFDRPCQCEESCTFFQDCCEDYTAVCGALKEARSIAKVQAEVAAATNLAKLAACLALKSQQGGTAVPTTAAETNSNNGSAAHHAQSVKCLNIALLAAMTVAVV